MWAKEEKKNKLNIVRWLAVVVMKYGWCGSYGCKASFVVCARQERNVWVGCGWRFLYPTLTPKAVG